MKRRLNNKGVSTVIAASILLAALVTVAITYQAFIVPELDREKAFTHSQDVLRNFEELYSEGKTTIQLSYAGSSFFSSMSFPGQLSYVPSTFVNVSVTNATQTLQEERFLNETVDINMQSLSDAWLYFENASEIIEASCNFTTSQEEVIVGISTEKIVTYSDDSSLMRICLNITKNSQSNYYNYSLMTGDSLQLPLFSPQYNLTSTLSKTKQIQYTTNSPTCMLFIRSFKAIPADLTYIAQGAIRYEPASFPLSYLATPWGVTAIEARTSSIPSPFQIYWSQDTLVLDLCNITWSNIGTISGSGSVGIKFKNQNQTILSSSFSRLDLNFTYSDDLDLKNSIFQLESFLKNGAPEGTLIYHEEGDDWVMVTVEVGTVDMSIHNVEAALS